MHNRSPSKMKEIIHIKTITQAHRLLGIEKPRHPLISLFYHSDPGLRYDFGDVRLRSDLYFIAFKEGITGSFEYGRSTYDFQEGVMLFVGPGQVLSPVVEVEADAERRSWNILFHPDLIRKSHLGEKIDRYAFFSYDSNEALHLSEEEKTAMTGLARRIEQEYRHNIDQHSQTLIISHLELMLNYAARYYDRQFYTRTNLNKDLVSKFEQLLKGYYDTDQPLVTGIPTVKYCGAQMNMSHKYLSDLLKKETGRNAQEHIHDFLIDRAKTRLVGTTSPIGQIAYDLGFEYSQHFAKLFKAKTGMTPSDYRRMN